MKESRCINNIWGYTEYYTEIFDFYTKYEPPWGSQGGASGPPCGPHGVPPPLGARSGFPDLMPCPVRPCKCPRTTHNDDDWPNFRPPGRNHANFYMPLSSIINYYPIRTMNTYKQNRT